MSEGQARAVAPHAVRPVWRGFPATLACLLAGCGGGSGGGGSSTGTEGTGGGPPPASSSGEGTTSSSSGAGTTASGSSGGPSDSGPDTTGPGGSTDGTTAPPVPDFDPLPWVIGDDVGYGVAYKDSQDPAAHNVFIGYAGYAMPLDAAQAWVTALYHADLRGRGVRHVYAVQGPATVMYSDLEIGNSHIAGALTTQAEGAAFVAIAAHSSGSYVAHELLGQLAGGLDPAGVTAGKVVYFNLEGGGGLTGEAVDRLRRAYFVSVYDGSTDTAAPNRGGMQLLGGQWPGKGAYLELDGAGAGCDAGAQWCLHMAVINHRPHDPSGSSADDYYDFIERPVVTNYIELSADEAGLHP